MFSPFANSEVVETCWRNMDRPDAINFYHGLHKNPYRSLVGNHLPSFIEGTQGMIAFIHLAYWLGCNPIVLMGVDQSRPIGWESMHGAPGAGWRPVDIEWYTKKGVIGEVETTETLDVSAETIAALSMWIVDSGRSIVNMSEGLDFVFAPHVKEPEFFIQEVENGRLLQEIA